MFKCLRKILLLLLLILFNAFYELLHNNDPQINGNIFSTVLKHLGVRICLIKWQENIFMTTKQQEKAMTNTTTDNLKPRFDLFWSFQEFQSSFLWPKPSMACTQGYSFFGTDKSHYNNITTYNNGQWVPKKKKAMTNNNTQNRQNKNHNQMKIQRGNNTI